MNPITLELISSSIFILNIHVLVGMVLFIQPRTEKQHIIWEKVLWANSYILMGVLVLFCFCD